MRKPEKPLIKCIARMFAACAMTASLSVTAFAAVPDTLNIGLGGAVNSVDPHFTNSTPNHVIAHSLFDRLTERSPQGELVPGLALAWNPVSDTVWEFKLRPDVKWHDGKPFTGEDVAFSLERARNVPNSPGGFGGQLASIVKVEQIAPLTVRLHTSAPSPNLPRQLAFIAIVSKHAGEGATTEQYNSGVKAIGTGPYKFVRYIPGDRIDMVRNDDWWGPKQPWKNVSIRFISNGASRVGALLSGGVDVIDSVPATDIATLQKDPKVSLVSTPGMRTIFIVFNVRSAPQPLITDNNGKPLATNPLSDVRVRRALSEAVNRQGIADRLMQNTAKATGQWLNPGIYSYADSVAIPSYDPTAAKKLLAEAGYPDGFKITLVTPNDRYPNDSAVAQAVAQMWSKIGVRTAVDARPWNTFIVGRESYPSFLLGWGSPTLEAGYFLTNIVMTPDSKNGVGSYNSGGYSNPPLDALTDRALTTLDDKEREKMLVQAVEMTSSDLPIMTILQLNNTWAVRKGFTYDPRTDERTLPQNTALVISQ
ncbi:MULTISPECIES: ABC transporter substrate-binding protein [unclassified Pseudomonas]|uniref:ABC transporter substrate-binding protein n=1 Tax=unclassified Pseudomonas TaxID=196821 RepID=UPI001CC07F5A|nr:MULTISPECIES: ABC transporter substrate-binding protein [unclassified Pseudomonas]